MLPFLVFPSLNRNFDVGASKLLPFGKEKKNKLFFCFSLT